MGLPSHKRTSSERKQRAYHARLKKRALSRCPQCGTARRPHHACTLCGVYRGRTVRQKKTTQKKNTPVNV